MTMCEMPRMCSTCSKWSDVMARANGPVVEALCIGPGPMSGEWQQAEDHCSAWSPVPDYQVDGGTA